MNKIKLILGLAVLGAGGYFLWKTTRGDSEEKEDLEGLGKMPSESNKPQYYAWWLEKIAIDRDACLRKGKDTQDCISAYNIAKNKYTGLLKTVGYKYERGKLVKLSGSETYGTTHGGNDASNGVPNGCVRFFEDINYKGAYKDYCESTSWVGEAHNDIWSSVQVGAGMKAVMCAERNYKGSTKEIKEDTPNLADWDNRMSSVMIGNVDDVLDSAVIGNWGDGNLDGTIDNEDGDITSGGLVNSVTTVDDEADYNMAEAFLEDIYKLYEVDWNSYQSRMCEGNNWKFEQSIHNDNYCLQKHNRFMELRMFIKQLGYDILKSEEIVGFGTQAKRKRIWTLKKTDERY
jgi:hypothetical protein